LGVVESRVSQIHSSAVLRLRSALAGLRPADSIKTAKPERRQFAANRGAKQKSDFSRSR
jgi:RNA polymerase sigma factor for flagellar operon FliA